MAKKKKKGMTGVDFLDMLLPGTANERSQEIENQIRKKILYYLEREELPFKKRLFFCKSWIEKRLEELKTKHEREEQLAEKNLLESKKYRNTSEQKEKEYAGMHSTAWLLGLARSGDIENEIKISEALLEEIEMTLETDETIINQGAFIGRVMDIIFIPREKEPLKKDSGKDILTTTINAKLIEEFQRDNPYYEKNVFVMMRFGESKELKKIERAIRNALSSYGFHGLRADDKTYGNSRLLWENLITYMHGCRFGIAVLEDLTKDEFNPNIALEYGYLRALGKQTLLLKERRFRNIRSDILGTIWIEFDILDIDNTIKEAIGRWIKDLI